MNYNGEKGGEQRGGMTEHTNQLDENKKQGNRECHNETRIIVHVSH